MSKWLAAMSAVLIAWSPGAFAADDIHIGDLMIKQAWARATIGKGKTGATYLSVMNRGSSADRLIAVETPVARRAGLHTHIVQGTVVKMRPVKAIEIAPGAMAALKPGGDHVMMMGLKWPLKKGKAFPLTLTFEKAGTVTVTVDIAGATAKSPAGGHDHSKHGHSKHDRSKLIDIAAGSMAPTLDIHVMKDSAGGWNLHIKTTHFRFAPDHASKTHIAGEGHAHLYVNGKKMARVYGPVFHIDSLPKGANQVMVTLYGNYHRAYAVDGVPVSRSVEVKAPSVSN